MRVNISQAKFFSACIVVGILMLVSEAHSDSAEDAIVKFCANGTAASCRYKVRPRKDRQASASVSWSFADLYSESNMRRVIDNFNFGSVGDSKSMKSNVGNGKYGIDPKVIEKLKNH
ncbi:hypothetical protein [Chromobacterium piscinae]|uniref:hypothetical protein n=1 Tax=Chromobacterium piscinae TaxID=686831 RepID=UPI003F8119C6